MSSRWSARLPAGLSFLALVACNAVLGIQELPADAGGGTPACTTSSFFGVTSCDTCAAQSCCSSYSSCLATADCMAVYNCIGACATGDTSCGLSCANSHQTGYSLLTDLFNCVSANCKTPCGQ